MGRDGPERLVPFIEESLIPAIHLCILNQLWVEKMYDLQSME